MDKVYRQEGKYMEEHKQIRSNQAKSELKRDGIVLRKK
jgi:hypothetical protein